MATAATAPGRFSDEDLASPPALIRDSDSVELKLTVPESDRRSAVIALGLDPLEAEIRQVFFFDTPELTLNQHGVVARARRIQGKGDDSVVKLRPVVPSELPPALRRHPGFGVEVDAMPGGFVCSGRLKVAVDPPIVRSTVAGERPLRKLFSKEQRRLFAAHAPDGISLDDLAVLGPVFVLKLSAKCAPSEAFQAAAETRAFLAGRGVDLSGEQETKTRKALMYFAGLLRDGGR